jgi:hypothetical protein
MKNIVLFIASLGCLVSVSCSSAGISGSLPIPFTDPPVNAKGEIEVTPLPPRFCIGLDVIPRPEED